MNKVVILLGGNLGQPLQNLEKSRNLISESIGSIQKESSLFQSKAWGFEAKELFINQVILLETKFSPNQLLNETQKIENLIGRKSKTINLEYSSRLIDIDILFYNNEIIKSPELIIPHPRLHLRNFTLAPLNELIPDYIHPKLQKTISWIYTNSNDKSICNKI